MNINIKINSIELNRKEETKEWCFYVSASTNTGNFNITYSHKNISIAKRKFLANLANDLLKHELECRHSELMKLVKDKSKEGQN